MTLEISINGEIYTFSDEINLHTIVEQKNQDNLPVAVAVNNEFIPKSRYEKTLLKNNDCIDIVSPVGGG